MASITIRGLEPEVKEQLRVPAARHGRWMEEEARVILRAEVLDGIRLLPKGKRREAIADAAEQMFEGDFRGRVRSFGKAVVDPWTA